MTTLSSSSIQVDWDRQEELSRFGTLSAISFSVASFLMNHSGQMVYPKDGGAGRQEVIGSFPTSILILAAGTMSATKINAANGRAINSSGEI
jgi:hypothetical protein